MGPPPVARRLRLRAGVVDGRRARADAEAAAPTFCAIVSDAAYATFLDAGLDRVGRGLGLGGAGRLLGRPAAYAGLGYVRLRYGVNLLDAALAAAQPAAMRWIVPGAAHTAAWRTAPRDFPRRIVAFFTRAG